MSIEHAIKQGIYAGAAAAAIAYGAAAALVQTQTRALQLLFAAKANITDAFCQAIVALGGVL